MLHGATKILSGRAKGSLCVTLSFTLVPCCHLSADRVGSLCDEGESISTSDSLDGGLDRPSQLDEEINRTRISTSIIFKRDGEGIRATVDGVYSVCV